MLKEQNKRQSGIPNSNLSLPLDRYVTLSGVGLIHVRGFEQLAPQIMKLGRRMTSKLGSTTLSVHPSLSIQPEHAPISHSSSRC